MPGTHPPIFWLGTSRGISHPILLRTFGYSRPKLVALRSLSLKPIPFGYKTPPIRFSQAGGGQSAHKARPPQPWTRVDATAPMNDPTTLFIIRLYQVRWSFEQHIWYHSYQCRKRSEIARLFIDCFELLGDFAADRYCGKPTFYTKLNISCLKPSHLQPLHRWYVIDRFSRPWGALVPLKRVRDSEWLVCALKSYHAPWGK